MNVEHCVRLHNEILRHGWVHSGRDPTLFENQCPLYFDQPNSSPPVTRKGRTPDLVRFLEQARVTGNNVSFSFHYWVLNLVCWSGEDDPLTSAMDTAADEDGRYLLLYKMEYFGSHCLGVLFDQETNLSIMCNTIYETRAVSRERTEWWPLETVLEVWLDQIRKGIFVAVPGEGDRRPHCSRKTDNTPWLMTTYTEAGLRETVDVFNRLVQAIEDRLPQKSVLSDDDDDDDAITGLVDEDDLRLMNIPDGFSKEFLRRAQRPHFKMIAPGLEVQQSSTFTQQSFWIGQGQNIHNVPPILLFRAVHPPGTNEEYKGPTGDDRVFRYSFMGIEDYAAGLYLSNFDDNQEDECLMILPFGIGANGYARNSDGSLYGEDRGDEVPNARDVFDGLYSPGHDPFGLIQSHNLRTILKNWLGMVERGDWQVDENGVMGGIDKWRDADTEAHSESYVLPIYEF